MAHSGSEVEATRLDRAAVGAVDRSDLLTDVLAIPEHMRDAQWKVESARLEEWDSPGGLIVAGMGGSAIGGALARAALGDEASRPIFPARAYGLPAWTQPDTTVLCASYSGNTEETLACFEAAGLLGPGASSCPAAASCRAWPARRTCRSSRWPAGCSPARPSPT